MSKPYIIIIGGGFHPAPLYAPLQDSLKEQGYDVETVNLQAFENPTTVTFESEIDCLRQVITRPCDEGRDVVIVAHSLGGKLATCAADGLSKDEREIAGQPGGVTRFVWITASVLFKGQAAPEGMDPGNLSTMEGVILTAKDPEHDFYNDLAPEEAAKWSALLKPHPAVAAMGANTGELWRSIPSLYVFCLRDNTVTLSVQENMIEKCLAEGIPMTIVKMDTSHSPWLSKLKELTEHIVRYLGD